MYLRQVTAQEANEVLLDPTANYYSVLNVPQVAAKADIRKAYLKRARNSTSGSSAAVLLSATTLATLDVAEGIHELIISSSGVVVSSGNLDLHVQMNYLVALMITIFCLVVGFCISCCWCCPRRCFAALGILVFGTNDQNGSGHKVEPKKTTRRHAMIQAPVHYNGQRYICAGNDFMRGMGASCETFAAE